MRYRLVRVEDTRRGFRSANRRVRQAVPERCTASHVAERAGGERESAARPGCAPRDAARTSSQTACESSGSVVTESVGPQWPRGIASRSARRGNTARRDSNHEQHRRQRREHNRIVGADVIEERTDPPRRRHRRGPARPLRRCALEYIDNREVTTRQSICRNRRRPATRPACCTARST